VTVCVQRAAGAPTAPSTVTVRTERPALQMKEPVSVPQDTEAQPARGVSPASPPPYSAWSPHSCFLTKRITSTTIVTSVTSITTTMKFLKKF